MIMKRKTVNLGFTTALTAALLLATTSFAGNFGKKQYDIADADVANGSDVEISVPEDRCS